MKRLVMALLILFSGLCFGATNGTYQWINVEGYRTVKISFASAPAASDVTTVAITGSLQRIVVRGTSTDADGTFAITDGTGATILTTSTVFSSVAYCDYLVSGVDINSNVAFGVPVFNSITLTLTNLAGLGATDIYIIFKVN